MLDPLLPTVPTARYYDSERSLWIISRYSEVVDAFRSDGPSAPGHDGFRQSAFARFSRDLIPATALRRSADGLLQGGLVELVSEFARPWSFGAAVRMLGLDEGVARELRPLASAVFAAAAEPFDAELQRQASDATVELGSVVGGPDVQAFVALTETLPGFYRECLSRAAAISRQHRTSYAGLGPKVASVRGSGRCAAPDGKSPANGSL